MSERDNIPFGVKARSNSLLFQFHTTLVLPTQLNLIARSAFEQFIN